jgi:Spy/CpxP family protein refolding chaperone
MKRILLTGIMLLALNFAVNAQEKKRTSVNFYSVEFLDEIGATADQKAKVADLMKEFQPKMNEVKKDESLSADDKKDKIKVLSAERSKKYHQILSAEQKVKLNEIKKELAKNKKEN